MKRSITTFTMLAGLVLVTQGCNRSITPEPDTAATNTLDDPRHAGDTRHAADTRSGGETR